TDATCDEGFEQQSEGPYTGLEYQPLCSFLYGDANCVARAEENNALTMDQASYLHLNIDLCMYPSFEVISAPFCAVGCALGWTTYAVASCLSIPPCTAWKRSDEAGLQPDSNGNMGGSLAENGWILHNVFGNAPLWKLNVLHLEGDIEYNESTTQDAFEKIGHAFSNIDLVNAEYDVDNLWRCVKPMAFDDPASLINYIGGGEYGFDYKGFLDALLPFMIGHGCACGIRHGMGVLGLPAYSRVGEEGSEGEDMNPRCFSASNLLDLATGPDAAATGGAMAFSFGVMGTNVFLRIDVGTKGNCQIQLPWEGWGSGWQAFRRLGLPVVASMATYLMTDRKNFAITLSTRGVSDISNSTRQEANASAEEAAAREQLIQDNIASEQAKCPVSDEGTQEEACLADAEARARRYVEDPSARTADVMEGMDQWTRGGAGEDRTCSPMCPEGQMCVRQGECETVTGTGPVP
ncbi:MAG: hypothetical protein AB1626_04915, partial [Candidatus Micrarchaeota archaeon]